MPACETLHRPAVLTFNQLLGGRGAVLVQHLLEALQSLLVVQNFQGHGRLRALTIVWRWKVKIPEFDLACRRLRGKNELIYVEEAQ
jgi:hypothetical protein